VPSVESVVFVSCQPPCQTGRGNASGVAVIVLIAASNRIEEILADLKAGTGTLVSL